MLVTPPGSPGSLPRLSPALPCLAPPSAASSASVPPSFAGSSVPCRHLGRHLGHLAIASNSSISKSDKSRPVILSSCRSQHASPGPAALTDPFSRPCSRSHRGRFVEILPPCFVHRSPRLAFLSINSSLPPQVLMPTELSPSSAQPCTPLLPPLPCHPSETFFPRR